MSTKIEPRRPLLAPRAGDFTDELIEPFTQFRSEVDRLFHAFPFRMPSLGLGTWATAPALEMTTTDKAYKITAEIPGMEPDDVEVTFEDGLLRIAGEKKEEREEDERGYRLSERSYGAFERMVKLPANADVDSLKAKFRNGVLTINIAKDHKEKKNVRRIKVDKA
jgi:HSP20 family protein